MSEATTWQQENDQRYKDLTDKLETGMKELFSSDKYKEYLNSMSKFHNYSSRNIMLIHQQMPGATRVASFKLWDEGFNRKVRRGEKSLRIFAPIKTEPEKKMMEKLDPETGAPMRDENGNAIMEEMTALNSGGIRFKLVPVFDVSQTYGDPLPELVEDLTGNVAHYEAFIDTLKAVSPLPIEFEPMKPEQDGYCRYGEKIGIREGMSEVQTVSAIVHEITHAQLHDKNALAPDDETKSKDIKEIEAESISYVVCQKYGIETGANSFGYLATWGSHDMKEIQASLDTIRKEANTLINAIDSRFASICKERGIDLNPAEQTQQELPVLRLREVGENLFVEETTNDFYALDIADDNSRVWVKRNAEEPPLPLEDGQVIELVELGEAGTLIHREQISRIDENTSIGTIVENEPEIVAEKPTEPEFTTESTTQNIAGVDFSFEEVKPVMPEQERPDTLEHRNYEKLAELFPQIESGEYSYLRFEAGAAMMPLSVEWIGDNQLSIMHTYTQNGDLMYDPMMVFEVDKEAKIATAVEFQQSNPPLYQRVDEDGIGHSIDGNGNERTVNDLQGQLNNFASQWTDNLKSQDYFPVRAYLADNELSDVEVYFNADKKPFNIGYMYEAKGTTLLNNLDNGNAVAFIDSSRNVTLFENNLPPTLATLIDNVELIGETVAQTEITKAEPESLQQAAEPLPDPTITPTDRDTYGYTAEDMLPLQQDRAIDLYNQDHTIFLLFNDNTEAMVFDSSEIADHDGIFGIEREDWQKSQEYRDMAMDNKANQQQEAVIESDFINAKEDTFAVYQIMDGKEFTRDYRFEGLDSLQQRGLEVNRNNYVIVHTEPLQAGQTLDDIFQKFNLDPPKDFSGHSLSMSDVVVLNNGGEITSHYVDSFGFTELPSFLGVEKQPEPEQTAPAVEQSDNEPQLPPTEPSAPELPDIPKSEQPIYKQSADHALENDEMQAWRDSRDLNAECGRAIDQAIIDCNYELYRYDLSAAARDVISEYGAERVAFVLASNIQDMEYDGRFSASNKSWAKEADVSGKPDYHLKTHPAILDGFALKFRKVEKEKPSLMAALKTGEEKSRKEHNNAQPKLDAPKKNREEI